MQTTCLCFKVIPLKLFYYQSVLLLKLGVINIHGMNIKKMQLIKNEVTVFVYTSAGSLNGGNSNHLHTELSLGYPKDTKFYLESQASFIDISSIASFKLFLVPWLR